MSRVKISRIDFSDEVWQLTPIAKTHVDDDENEDSKVIEVLNQYFCNILYRVLSLGRLAPDGKSALNVDWRLLEKVHMKLKCAFKERDHRTRKIINVEHK